MQKCFWYWQLVSGLFGSEISMNADHFWCTFESENSWYDIAEIAKYLGVVYFKEKTQQGKAAAFFLSFLCRVSFPLVTSWVLHFSFMFDLVLREAREGWLLSLHVEMFGSCSNTKNSCCILFRLHSVAAFFFTSGNYHSRLSVLIFAREVEWLGWLIIGEFVSCDWCSLVMLRLALKHNRLQHRC